MIAQEILSALEEEGAQIRYKARSYIGASIIGNDCTAYLNYSLRGFPENSPSPKLLRIFNVGHALEPMVVDDLKKKGGYGVSEVDELTGDQYEYTALGDHVVCHLDGIIYVDEEPCVLEIKTMNKSKFNAFEKKGVKTSHPQYFAQCMLAMHLSGMHKSFLVAICKDDCRYHIEVIEYDEFEASALKQKIWTAVTEPERISPVESDWRCRGCFKRTSCWHPEELDAPPKCSMCKHAKPDIYAQDKQWHCGKHDRPAVDPCEDYEMLLA
jgi:hypothetical protein